MCSLAGLSAHTPPSLGTSPTTPCKVTIAVAPTSPSSPNPSNSPFPSLLYFSLSPCFIYHPSPSPGLSATWGRDVCTFYHLLSPRAKNSAWHNKFHPKYSVLKQHLALASVAQWTECWPVNQRVTCSIPSWGTCLVCRPGPQCGARERQPHIDVSLPLFLPSFPSI